MKLFIDMLIAIYCLLNFILSVISTNKLLQLFLRFIQVKFKQKFGQITERFLVKFALG